MPPLEDEFPLALADPAIGCGHLPATAQQALHGQTLALQHAQAGLQIVAAGLATVEGRNGPTGPDVIQADSLHFQARLLDMGFLHPSIALGQAAEQDEQQILLFDGGIAPQARAQVAPGFQLQAPVEHLAQQRTEHGARDARQGEAGNNADQSAGPDQLRPPPSAGVRLPPGARGCRHPPSVRRSTPRSPGRQPWPGAAAAPA
ncbi:hypothetical protein D9M72_527150 [compost metagenome]